MFFILWYISYNNVNISSDHIQKAWSKLNIKIQILLPHKYVYKTNNYFSQRKYGKPEM